MQTFQIIPTTPTGYTLNQKRGAMAIVIPEATTNLIVNPSFETNTTSWAVTGGATGIARDPNAGLFGAYGLDVMYGVIGGAAKGARYTFGASTALSGIYTASAYVRAPMGMQLALMVNSTTVATAIGRGLDIWLRMVGSPLSVTSAGSATVDIVRTAGGETIDNFTIDGVQFEQKAYATTYCDGDQAGFVARELAYVWFGLAHGSTSQRLATTRAGGKIISLDEIGLKVLSLLGLGMPPLSVIATPVAQGGAYYQATIPQTRTFSLVGVMSAASEQALDQQRSLLTQYLSPERLQRGQPLRMIYQNYAQDGVTPISFECDILCHYAGGLEGVRNGLFQERATPEFRMFMPAFSRTGFESASLAVQESVADTDYIIQRNRDGDYSALGTGLGGQWQAAVEGDDGYRYVGGVFNSAGGVANTAGIARWNPVTAAWSAVGTGADASGNVEALAKLADGAIIAVGSFTGMSGVANTRFIAKWTPATSTWSSIGTTTGGAEINSIAVAPNGDIYVGGIFATIGGVVAANAAKYDGSTWSALGTGPNGSVYTMAINQPGTQVIFGGNFTSADGVANTNRIASWSPSASAWSALSTGMDGDVIALQYGPNQALYVGGTFTTAGGVAATALAVWNGTVFSTLGGGVSGSITPQVVDFAFDMAGNLHLAGTFTTAGRTPIPYGYAIWTGSAFIPGDIAPSDSATVDFITIFPNGDIWLAYFGGASDSITAINTTIIYDGTAESYPTFRITGPTSGAAKALYQIVNETTNVGIYLNVSLLVGEIVTLDLDPRSPTYGLTSSTRGNLIANILAGSNLADWALQPGENLVSVFTAGSTMTVTAIWRVNYLAIEHAVLR